jgi:hypothetical protein
MASLNTEVIFMDRSQEKYDIQLERSRNWKKQNPERHAELARAYRERNKEKTKAQNLLNYAVRTGKIERGTCESCGTSDRVHGHHHDYSKPYDVKWLCFACHKKSHPVDDEDKAIKFSGAKPASMIGSKNPYSSLTEADVLLIRQMLDIGVSQKKIAKAFDVHQTAISKIKMRQSWSHLK